MRLQTLGSLVLAFASSGCVLAAVGAQQATINAQIESSKDQACEMVAQQVAPTCSDESIKSLSYVMAGDQAAQSVAGAKMRCDMSASGQERSKELGECIDRLRAGTAAERELQQKRLPAEREKVPAVKATPGFTALADEYKELDHAALVASDNLKIAREEGNANVYRYQARYEEVKAKRDDVRARMNKIYESNGIDLRDPPLLGLP